MYVSFKGTVRYGYSFFFQSISVPHIRTSLHDSLTWTYFKQPLVCLSSPTKSPPSLFSVCSDSSTVFYIFSKDHLEGKKIYRERRRWSYHDLLPRVPCESSLTYSRVRKSVTSDLDPQCLSRPFSNLLE